ncbi:cell growth-regulating nucleolar protein [Nephila pilipes]|uniref:Cell growth-regulating nucleolar protein n=1 Tax=Nephila pilipes TaxID=299642 RepID=A0A8X6P032_NEPPI|nr:cell growth-regulating nucleolar protein [Nephila pilipes]
MDKATLRSLHSLQQVIFPEQQTFSHVGLFGTTGTFVALLSVKATCQLIDNEEFWGDDYKLHTKCITENEKYGGKNFVPKASSNKGEIKQEKWIEHINTVLATKKVSSSLSQVLKQIVQFQNIPRKKTKFENFLWNSFKIRQKKLIAEAWEIVEQGSKNESGKSNVSITNGENGTSLSDGTNSEINGNSTSTKRSSDCQDDKPPKKIHLSQNNEENENKSNGFDWCAACEKILEQYPLGIKEKALRKQVTAKYKAFVGDSCTSSDKELKTIFKNQLSNNSSFSFYVNSS